MQKNVLTLYENEWISKQCLSPGPLSVSVRECFFISSAFHHSETNTFLLLIYHADRCFCFTKWMGTNKGYCVEMEGPLGYPLPHPYLNVKTLSPWYLSRVCVFHSFFSQVSFELRPTPNLFFSLSMKLPTNIRHPSCCWNWTQSATKQQPTSYW